jgi:hypothetical protein
MRGGAIPFLVWGTINLVLIVADWIWVGTGVHVAEGGAMILVIYLFGLAFLLRSRTALRQGPPEYVPEADPLPRASLGAAGTGVACGLILLGVVFGKFLIFIGGGLLLLSLGSAARELVWQRRTLAAVRRERRP